MLTASTYDLNLAEVHLDSDPRNRVRVNFPINKAAGAADSAVVYFEIAPGDRLASHTDSEEEVLYIVAGEAEATVGDETGRVRAGDRLASHTDSEEEVLYIVAGEAEATVGDETGRVRAGDLAVIPAMVPHGLVNVGDETVKVVGFFSGAEVTSTFAEPVQPIGQTSVVQEPIPA